MRILIASYTFPPTGGIGGRRWAKFAKYFQRLGAEVSVISASANSQNSPWSADVSTIHQTHFKSSFPGALTRSPRSIWEKLVYRVQLFRMRRVSEGTPYDRAILDKSEFQAALKSEIQRFQPNVVIATGAPFRILNYTLGLRKFHPKIKFFADFRDPWTWGEAFGYSALSSKRLKYERQMEREVLEGFDGIWSPSEDIISRLAAAYPAQAKKLSTVAHGFDVEDIPLLPAIPAVPKTDRVLLVYGGTIYHQSHRWFQLLADFAGKSTKTAEWEIYSQQVPDWLCNRKNVRVNHPLPSKAFFTKAAKAEWLVLIIPPHVKDSIPTKVLECAALRKPILMLGERGRLSDFVLMNKLGLFAESEVELSKILFSTFVPDMDKSVMEAYGFEQISANLLGLIAKTPITS